MDAAEDHVLAYMTFHPDHWTRISSTNPLERLNGEIKRRTDVAGIFPNEAAIIRLIGALMLEQNDEWAVGRRYTLPVLAEAVRNIALFYDGLVVPGALLLPSRRPRQPILPRQPPDASEREPNPTYQLFV